MMCVWFSKNANTQEVSKRRSEGLDSSFYITVKGWALTELIYKKKKLVFFTGEQSVTLLAPPPRLFRGEDAPDEVNKPMISMSSLKGSWF